MTSTQPFTKAFTVILNAEPKGYALSNWPEFYEANIRKQHLFGTRAQAAGEAPIKAIVVFADGNPQGLRGDRYNAVVIDMVRGLHRMIQRYHKENNLLKAEIFDNRGYLPDGQRKILCWEVNRGTTINLLPLYLPEVQIKPAQ